MFRFYNIMSILRVGNFYNKDKKKWSYDKKINQ